MNTKNKADDRLQWIVVGVAVLIRAVVLWILGAEPLIGDPRSYFELSKKISAGAHYIPQWPPGLPYYLAVWNLAFGAHEFVARLSSLFLFVAFILVFRRFLNDFVGKRLCTLALVVVASYPVFIDHSTDVLTHLPSAVCLTIALLCIQRLVTRFSVWDLVWIGAALGSLVLIRASSFLLFLGLPIYLGWRFKQIKYALIPLLIGVAIIGIWEYKAYRLTGDYIFVNTFNNYNFYLGNSPWTPNYRTWWLGSHGPEGIPDSLGYVRQRDSINSFGPKQQSAFYREAAQSYIVRHPLTFIERTVNRFNAYFAFDSFTAAYEKNLGASKGVIIMTLLLDACFFFVSLVLTLALLAFEARRVRNDLVLLSIIGSLILYSFPYWISFSHPVYHMAILPLLITLASYFLKVNPFRSWRERWGQHFSTKQKFAFGLLFLYAIFIQIQFALHMADRM